MDPFRYRNPTIPSMNEGNTLPSFPPSYAAPPVPIPSGPMLYASRPPLPPVLAPSSAYSGSSRLSSSSSLPLSSSTTMAMTSVGAAGSGSAGMAMTRGPSTGSSVPERVNPLFHADQEDVDAKSKVSLASMSMSLTELVEQAAELEQQKDRIEAILVADPENLDAIRLRVQIMKHLRANEEVLRLKQFELTTNSSSSTDYYAHLQRQIAPALMNAPPSSGTASESSASSSQYAPASTSGVNGTDSGTPLYERDENELRSFSTPSFGDFPVGSVVLAFYPSDKRWYTSRILEHLPNQEYLVQYVGFNEKPAELPVTRIHPFVPPDRSRLALGSRCYAIHPTHGLFYEALVDGSSEEGNFWVSFPDGIVHEVNETQIRPIEELGILSVGTQGSEAPSIGIGSLAGKKRPTETRGELTGGQLKARKAERRRRWEERKKEDQDKKKNDWQKFMNKKVVKKVTKKESIFKSPETLDGRVGVVGSDRTMSEQKKFNAYKGGSTGWAPEESDEEAD